MLKAYALKVEGVEFRTHGVSGIFVLKDKIIVLHFASGVISKEEHANGICSPKYVICDIFSFDFSRHEQRVLSYEIAELFAADEAVCYEQDGKIFINTKKYRRWNNDTQIGKIIELAKDELVHISDAPTPEKYVWNDKRRYEFDGFWVKMKSSYVMECGETASKSVRWRQNYKAYLYTQIKLYDGILYFGLAGNGGRLCAVRPEDGSVIFDYNNGDTDGFLWTHKGILLGDNMSKLVIIDPKTGKELEQLEFGELTLSHQSKMILHNGKFYAFASDKNGLCVVCADL